MKRIEGAIEWILFQSRWILALLYLGLVAALVLVVIEFALTFVDYIPKVKLSDGDDTILAVLTLVDLVLVADLVLLMIVVGYGTMRPDGTNTERADRLTRMGTVDTGASRSA